MAKVLEKLPNVKCYEKQQPLTLIALLKNIQERESWMKLVLCRIIKFLLCGDVKLTMAKIGSLARARF